MQSFCIALSTVVRFKVASGKASRVPGYVPGSFILMISIHPPDNLNHRPLWSRFRDEKIGSSDMLISGRTENKHKFSDS